jgi:hypothetical protein
VEELVIVNIIKDTDPFSCLFIPKPVLDKFIYVDFRILTTGDLNLVRNVPETLLEPGFITRMDPEDPCRRRFGPNPVGVFDGKLRFPSSYQ